MVWACGEKEGRGRGEEMYLDQPYPKIIINIVKPTAKYLIIVLLLLRNDLFIYLFVQKDHPARPLGDITQGKFSMFF